MQPNCIMESEQSERGNNRDWFSSVYHAVILRMNKIKQKYKEGPLQYNLSDIHAL